jgi:hypothetical protein
MTTFAFILGYVGYFTECCVMCVIRLSKGIVCNMPQWAYFYNYYETLYVTIVISIYLINHRENFTFYQLVTLDGLLLLVYVNSMYITLRRHNFHRIKQCFK